MRAGVLMVLIRRILRSVVAAVVAVALVAPGADAAFVVRGREKTWRPRLAEVSKGTKVVWRAVVGSHTVTAYKGRWSKDTRINEGQKTAFTLPRTGIFKYRCEFHSTLSEGTCSGMCGKVRVV